MRPIKKYPKPVPLFCDFPTVSYQAVNRTNGVPILPYPRILIGHIRSQKSASREMNATYLAV